MNDKTQNTQQLIVSYETLESQGATLEEKIEMLKALKKTSKVEEWSYRLAVAYDQAGMTEECLDQCDELLLWYNNGIYTKAVLELKDKYDALTPLQRAKYVGLAEKEKESLTDRLPDMETYINRQVKTGSVKKDPVKKDRKETTPKKEEPSLKPDAAVITEHSPQWEESIQGIVQEQLQAIFEKTLQEQLPPLLTKAMKAELPAILERVIKISLAVTSSEDCETDKAMTVQTQVNEPMSADCIEPKRTAEENTDAERTESEASTDNTPAKAKRQEWAQCYLLVGPRGTYTSKEAIKTIKALQKKCAVQGKLVKTSASRITSATLKRISELDDLGVVVIEDAAELSADIVNALNEILERGEMPGLVVLADENDALKRLLVDNIELRGKFTSGVRY